MPSVIPSEATLGSNLPPESRHGEVDKPDGPVRVLLVDDQPANLVVLRAILDGMGYVLVEAHSGEEALRLLQQDEFALVLLDVLMPTLDGFETARLIRSQKTSRHTPIIFLSAYETEQFPVKKAYSLGAVDYLLKPLVPEILRAKVAGLVDLYEQKQQVKRQGELLRLLVEGTTDVALFMLDPTGRVLTWNPGAERITGYRAEEVLGRSFSCFYPAEDVEAGRPERELRLAVASGKYEEESWRVRKDGSRFWASVVLTALRDVAGHVRGFSKITQDVTARRQAEENARRLLEEEAARRAIQENEERLRFALNAARMIAWDWDLTTGICVRSENATSILGLQTGPIEEFLQQVHPEDRERVESAIAGAVHSGTSYEIEFRIRTLDGRTLWVVDRAEPRFGDKEQRAGSVSDGERGTGADAPVTRSGDRATTASAERSEEKPAVVARSPDRVTGVCCDITVRKQAEFALRASEQRFRQLADSMPPIVWTTTPEGQTEYLNQRWHELTGLPVRNQPLAEELKSVIHPDDLNQASERWQQALQTETPFQIELRILDRKAGVYRWHLARAVPGRDESGRIIRWYGTSTNIDEQKRAEESSRFLAEASATLARVIDYETTLQKLATLAVPWFADWCGVDMKEPDAGLLAPTGRLRRLAVAHVDPSKVEMARELHRRWPPDPKAEKGPYHVLRTGQPELIPEIPEEVLLAAGQDEQHRRAILELGLVSWLCVAIQVRGETLGVLSFATAESGRRYGPADLRLAVDLANRASIAIENAQLYSELREASRRKDEFLAMLAHELRNPLAPIRNALQIMKMPSATPAVVEQAREMTERQVHTMVRLVDDLLDVSRIMRGKIELRKEAIDLATVVARAVETAQPILDSQGQQLLVSLPAEPVRLEADLTRLTQVVGNLLHNAAKYSQHSGRVWLSAERQGNEVLLRVKDEGVGIRPDLLSHVFDLFVQGDRSLERSQGGLGIGLTVVRKLVQMHGGSVTVHSKGVGQGSEFTIRLPVLKEGPRAEESSRPSQPARSRHSRRVLVVDDNVDAAESVAMLVKMCGHEVRVAHTGPDALQAAEVFEPEIIVLDIGLPGMNGHEVACRLRQQPRFARTVLAALTGYGQEEDRRKSQEAGFNYHLTKPVDPDTLLRLVNGLLGKRDSVAGGKA